MGHPGYGVTSKPGLRPSCSQWNIRHTGRCFGLQPDERVLILGATSTSRRITVAAAKALGASEIVATARNRQVLEEPRHSGTTVVVNPDSDDLVATFRKPGAIGFDIVIDFLDGALQKRHGRRLRRSVAEMTGCR
ncbi:zinc-binding dehydrogenase [Martelella soudanensis]|uniref:zinc-binding dehydrogenase n=1 Tax=Martelella sp. NC20 TaxID=2740298 RepID=UPI003530185C